MGNKLTLAKRVSAFLAALMAILGLHSWAEPLLEGMDSGEFRLFVLGCIVVSIFLVAAGVFELVEHIDRQKEHKRLHDDFDYFIQKIELEWNGNDVTVLEKPFKDMYPFVRRLAAHFGCKVEGAPD